MLIIKLGVAIILMYLVVVVITNRCTWLSTKMDFISLRIRVKTLHLSVFKGFVSELCLTIFLHVVHYVNRLPNDLRSGNNFVNSRKDFSFCIIMCFIYSLKFQIKLKS